MSQKNVPSSDQRTWPNLFLVGTVKGGTTSLYQHLSQHPQVFFPEFKEPHYFAQICPSPERAHMLEYLTEEKDYLRLYRSAGNHLIIGDASTSNLWSKDAPKRIHQQVPAAKILILLRDPVDRAHSHYLMDYREGVIHEPLTVELLRRDYEQPKKAFGVSYLYVDMGLYYEQVKRYLEVFGPEQILLLQFDDLVNDPESVVASVAQFLGIDPDPFSNMDLNRVHNGFKAARGNLARRCAAHPWARWIGYHMLSKDLQWWLYQNLILKQAKKPSIPDSVQNYLQSIYDPDIVRLEKLIKKQLPALRRSW